MRTTSRAHERMVWLLRRIAHPVWHQGFITAWEVDDVKLFLAAFPEAEKTTKWYTMGAPSVPMLNAAAQRAKRAGYLRAGHIGNEDAKSYNQRTWCRTWSLTMTGRGFLAEADVAKD